MKEGPPLLAVRSTGFWHVISGSALFWVSLWVSLNIGLTILNKSVFQFTNFHYPLILSASHMLCMYVFCYLIFDVFKWLPVDNTIAPATIQKIRLLSFLFTINILAGNVSLMYSSVSLREVVRSLTPGITLVFSVWLLKKSFTAEAVWSLLLIAIGVILTTVTELDFHLMGFIILVAGCILAALKGVLTNMLLIGTGAVHPLYVLYLMSPLALAQMLSMAVVFGEVTDLINTWQDRPIGLCAGMIGATALMAFFLNVANFNLNKITSPVTVSVAGSFKETVTIGLSFVIFQNKVTPLNLLGIAIALTGTGMYHYFAHGKKHETAAEKKHDSVSSDDTPDERRLSLNMPSINRVEDGDTERSNNNLNQSDELAVYSLRSPAP